MLVANSFDLWQKDTFFSAAEEVQQSADIMESTYRTWLRAKREGLKPQQIDELGRELQMALGTAKWQLEEFERAVRLSYKKHNDDITITRHRQFISALEDQIFRAESDLKESFNTEGKNQFRWVDLDEDENDDFALFLSGNPAASQGSKDESINRGSDCSIGSEISSKMQFSSEGKSLEVVTSKFNEMGGENMCKDYGMTSNLEVVIDCNDDGEKNASIQLDTPKVKGSKSLAWKSRDEGHYRLKIMNWMNQKLRGGPRSQGQLQVSAMGPVNSIRFALVLMLTIFLVVPFLLYST